MLTRDHCIKMDRDDPLAKLRDEFYLEPDVIYLDGNSMGALPKRTAKKIGRTLDEEWGKGLIRSWGAADWYAMPETLGDRLGRLIGADEGQIVVCDTTSINIYKALRAAMQMRPDRGVIVSETSSFPTDLYMIEGAKSSNPTKYSTKLLGRDGSDIADLIDKNVAVILLSNVDYKTGKLHDMKRITDLAHNAGALIIWDLCHSAGVIPIELDNLGVDFAVGCTYKYLNSGPGSPAYIYVAKRHQDTAVSPLSGWWGHAEPFAFEAAYRPTTGVRRFLCGTQPVLSMKGIEASLDVFDQTNIHQIREKSQKLTRLFIDLAAQHPVCSSLEMVSPINDEDRGGHVSFRFENGYPVVKAMIEKGVIGDFRAPDIMRFGFAPYYLRYLDVYDAVETMAQCIEAEVWKIPKYCEMETVT